MLRSDLASSEDLNAKLRDQRAIANADIDRLTSQNSRLAQEYKDNEDRLGLERADKDMLNRRVVELLDANEATRMEARRKEEALNVREREASDAASRLLALRGELRDA